MILHYSDEDVLDGLRQKKSSYISYMYEEFIPLLRHLVFINSGNEQDMQDLFQDALIILYQRILNQPFNLECSLKTYFMSVSKNLWLQRLERKSRLLYQADLEVHEAKGAYTIEDLALSEENLELQRLFYKNLLSLPTECQRLIKLYCLNIPYREIARLLNYKDEIYVRTRKYSCKNLLRKKIMMDPECQQFLSYERNDHNQRLD